MPANASTPRLTQAERTARSERRMINAAVRLISRQGYTKTTLAQVGEESGYSRGLVSHRFGSKAGLLEALMRRITGRFLEDQVRPAIDDRSGIAALVTMVDTYFNELTAREERLRTVYVLMGEALGPVPEIRDVFMSLNKGFRDNARQWIEDGIATGEMRAGLDPSAEAALFIGTLRGVAMQWITEPRCFDLEAVRESIKDAVRRHLARRSEDEE